MVLVLDEYDRIIAPEVAEQLEFVLHHSGQGLRLVLVTRTEPLLPLHRYRAADELTEIRGAELSFTPEEAGALLRLHGLRLPESAASALVDRTRGWAAGLRLSALAARESTDPERYLKEFEADHSTVADFLLAEVLKGRTEETQDLLLRVSVLDRFCPGLADSLTLRTDAERLLAELHRENAFIERLGHSWYRLHPLFREILRAHLRERMPGAEAETHLRAARWLRRSGFLPETLAHGAAGGDFDLAAGALVDGLAIGQLFTGLRSDALAQLFAGMGPEAGGPASDLVRAAARTGPTRPRAGSGPAATGSGAALRNRGLFRPGGGPAELHAAGGARRPAHRMPFAGRAGRCDGRGTAPGPARPSAGRASGTDRPAADTRGFGPPVGRTLRRRTCRAEPCGRCPGRIGHRPASSGVDGAPGPAGLPQRLARPCGTQGSGRGVRGGADRTARPPGAGLGRLVLAAVAVDRQELGRARDLLDETARPPAREHDPVPMAGRALALSHLLLDEGETRAAAEAAEPTVATAVASPWAESQAAVVRSAVCLADGRPDEAVRLLDGVSVEYPVCAVEAAGIQVAAGRPRAAAELLGAVRAEGRTGPAASVGAALVRARVAQESGDTVTARRLVARALLDARRERLRRPFLQTGDWIEPLLATAPLHELAEGWLLSGRPRTHGEPVRPAAGPALLVPVELSGRERDVLRRLARMMSAEEIAADLYVSVNTVKTHLKSVYRKLAVNRRGDAVHRARDLGLL
ncbi:HTH-type transcriptional regulator MalT [Streptomyces tendae]